MEKDTTNKKDYSHLSEKDREHKEFADQFAQAKAENSQYL